MTCVSEVSVLIASRNLHHLCGGHHDVVLFLFSVFSITGDHNNQDLRST